MIGFSLIKSSLTPLIAVFALWALTLSGALVAAEVKEKKTEEERLKELEEKVEYLTDELRKAKLEQDTGQLEEYGGLSPAASKVYYNNPGLSLGGYGEFKYRNYSLSSDGVAPANQADIHRIILYTGYKFSDSIVLNTEVEFEHAGVIREDNQDHNPAVFVEFAYMDFLLTESFNLRTGLLLVPLGLVNQLHEPVVFRGTERPSTESIIIPSTWREVGLMAHGKLPAGFSYNAGIVNGQNISGISEDRWLSGTKQSGSLAKAEDIAGFLRADWEGFRGYQFGVSAYYGGAGQDILPGKANVFLADAHTRLQFKGFEVRGLFVMGRLSDIEDVNRLAGQIAGSPQSIGSEVMGYYGELGYDLWPLFASSPRALIPFVRYETYNLQQGVESGEIKSKTGDVTVLTAGIDFKPIYKVVIKADYQSSVSAAAGAEPLQAVNLSLGFIF